MGMRKVTVAGCVSSLQSLAAGGDGQDSSHEGTSSPFLTLRSAKDLGVRKSEELRFGHLCGGIVEP